MRQRVAVQIAYGLLPDWVLSESASGVMSVAGLTNLMIYKKR